MKYTPDSVTIAIGAPVMPTPDRLRQLAAAIVQGYCQPRLTLGEPEVEVTRQNDATREVTFAVRSQAVESPGLTDEQSEALTDLLAKRMAERSRNIDELTALLGECCEELGL